MRTLCLILILACSCSLSAATFTVTNTNDSGAGSFRQAVLDANAASGLDTIDFNLTSTPATITMGSGLTVSSPLIITGPGARALTFTASGSGYRFLLSNSGATVEISDISITGFNGGANSGGVFGQAGTLPALTLTRVAVRNSGCNTAGMAQVNGSFTAVDCEFSSISANTGANAVISCSGSLVSMTNCTITGCSSATTGGVLTMFAGTATFTNCTITGNTTGTTGGALRVSGASSSITLRNTILAANVNGNGSGAFTSNGFNLIDSTTGMTITTQSTDIVGSSPNLAALADNGGPTNTLALNTGSPCIDAGDSSSSTTDQRGQSRPFDETTITDASDGADIGAFEWHPAAATPTIQTTGTFTNFATTGSGVVSPEQQFTVEGTGLTQPITITPPQHWEVSFTSGGTFTSFPSTISTAAPTAGVVSTTTVFVRYNPSAAPPHSGNVVMSSAGATNASLAVNGIQPSANATGLDFNAGEGATPNVGSWTISLNAPLSVPITVNFTIGGGTGTGASTVPSVDYDLSVTAAGVTFSFIGASGNTMDIAAGITSFVVTLTPVDDALVEPSE
ncbi:MAG: hypothetical protein KDG44_01245, partial [Burkholderiaceae bacterium]|nr:hypothetical protein [Burkholderiaceae bacterium]